MCKAEDSLPAVAAREGLDCRDAARRADFAECLREADKEKLHLRERRCFVPDVGCRLAPGLRSSAETGGGEGDQARAKQQLVTEAGQRRREDTRGSEQAAGQPSTRFQLAIHSEPSSAGEGGASASPPGKLVVLVEAIKKIVVLIWSD